MMDRREFVGMLGATAIFRGWPALLPVNMTATGTSGSKSILMFTKSSGFEHSVIKRSRGRLSFAEQILVDLGKHHGFEVTASKDGRVFSSREASLYDAFFFYTTGDLTTGGTDGNPPMSAMGKQAFLDLIYNGKGFVGAHCATDTFDTARGHLEDRGQADLDPYQKMIGAEFLAHDQQQKGTVEITDRQFPGFKVLSGRLDIVEEWYTFRNYQRDLHVLTVLETRGMTGPHYQRPPFPNTWARMHGQGRVFYTALGHREDVWASAAYQDLLLAGIQWVLKNEKADVSPNIMRLTPDAIDWRKKRRGK